MHEKLIKNQYVAAKTRRNIILKSINNVDLKKKSINNGLKLKTWIFCILGFLLVSLFIINNIITGQFRDHRVINITQENIAENEIESNKILIDKKTDYLVKNKGCRILSLNPFDEFSKKFLRIIKPIECEYGNQLPLVESNDTHLFINRNAIVQYYNNTETIDCCWRSFERRKYNDNSLRYDLNCHKFNNTSKVFAETEYVKVECYKANKTRIFKDYYIFVPDKEKNKEEENNEKKKLSVLVIGLDSISRLNFHRMMPKTVDTLKQFGAIEMLGYNKVGDNTYPNLVPVLTGMSDKELELNCWINKDKPFDNCPFIWKNFSTNGYHTVFAEDACGMTTFNYLKPGFRIQPTDYYYRPYCIASENDIGNTHKLNSNLCVGTRLNYQNLLNYTMKIVKKFNNNNNYYFGFFWQASLTHDYFNYPQLGDNSYKETIDYIFNNKYMNNTALIVMSDHGIRWGEFRQTFQGRIEGSLPFLFIILPEWWKANYPKAWFNIKHNTASLTTPFDLHETLFDLLNLSSINDINLYKRDKLINDNNNNNNNKLPRGISLFISIPDYRTCDMANIPGHYCMCHKSSNISINDKIIKNKTNYLINEINNMLNKYSNCEKLYLNNIIDAKIWSDNDDDDNKNGAVPLTDYTITFETKPGYAIFEATIRQTIITNNSTYIDDKIIGTISRINAYGNQSACIDDSKMRLYCYCSH